MSLPSLKYFLTEEARSKGLALKLPRTLDAGFDLPCLEDSLVEPGKTSRLQTGIHLAIPEGWVGLLRDRSSVASKGGSLLAGVIDAGYRGEVQVLLHNLGSNPLSFSSGDRIAQCIIVPHLSAQHTTEVNTLQELGQTTRASQGFGSTGT